MHDVARPSLLLPLLIASAIVTALLVFATKLPAYALLTASWAVVLLISRSRAQRGAASLVVRRSVPAAAFEDDVVDVELAVENAGESPVELIDVTDRFGASLSPTVSISLDGPIAPGEAHVVRYEARCSCHWGRHHAGPIVVTASEPLGLFQARRTLPDLAPISLFPHVYAVNGLARFGARAILSPHEASAPRPGQGALHLGVRDYQPGDDPRRMNWRASARQGRLLVRQQEVDLAPWLTLLLDLQGEHRTGLGRESTLERLVRTAASLLTEAARQGWHVQVLGEGATPLSIPAGRGDAHLAAALEALIAVRQDGRVPLGEVTERHLASVPSGSTALLLYGTSSPQPEDVLLAIEGLRGRGAQPAIVLIDDASFKAIARRDATRAQALSRRREVEALAADRRVELGVIEADEPLPERLARGLFAP